LHRLCDRPRWLRHVGCGELRFHGLGRGDTGILSAATERFVVGSVITVFSVGPHFIGCSLAASNAHQLGGTRLADARPFLDQWLPCRPRTVPSVVVSLEFEEGLARDLKVLVALDEIVLDGAPELFVLHGRNLDDRCRGSHDAPSTVRVGGMYSTNSERA